MTTCSRDQPNSFFSSVGSAMRSIETNIDSLTNNNTSKASNATKEQIDCKFNELAKKILDELKQAQYSKDFFQAIDEILKEPIGLTFTRTYDANRIKNRKNRKSCSSNNASLIVNRQQVATQTVSSTQNKLTQVNEPQQQQHQQQPSQPRSLPVYVRQPNSLTSSLVAASDQRLSSKLRPTGVGSTHSNSNATQAVNLTSPKRSSVEHNNQQINSNQNNLIASSYPITKSATTSDSNAKKELQQTNQVRKSTSTTLNDTEGTQMYRKQKNYVTLANRMERSVFNNEDGDDDDEDDDDDDDDDDDSDDDDAYGDVGNYGMNDDETGRNSYLSQRFSPKNTPTSEQINNKQVSSTVDKHSSSVGNNQAHYQQSSQPSKQFSNKLVKSNTISNAKYSTRERNAAQNNQKKESSSNIKSSMLSSKDIGPLYKPHMNYSTSVLGNHRLSDDDEIIIIPTQSPSLISTSPDADANTDDLTERFSISRTKSFWEKLSKTNNNKRETNSANDNNGATLVQQQQHYLQQNHNNYQQQQHNGHHHLGNKVIGVRMNGHSHNLDRMDSTGGSNSNYSCSSSGDENGGPHSTQNPTINQLQEMSRQNRLRQTR